MKNERVRRRRQSVSSEEVADKLKVIDGNVILPRRSKARHKPPGRNDLEDIVSRVTTSANDNLAMLELLPDLMLVRRVMVSSILSPKDLSNVKLRLSIDKTIYGEEVPPDLITDLEAHFRTTYDFEGQMSKILEEALFDYGSNCALILSESTLSKIVQGNQVVGMESFSEIEDRCPNLFGTRNILGKPNKPDILSAAKIKVSDNPMLMLMPMAHRIATDAAVSDLMQEFTAMEAYKPPAKKEEVDLKQYPPLNVEPLVTFKQGQGETSDTDVNGLVMDLPSDCLVPIHAPGNPRDHVGYYCLLDSDNLPLTGIRQSNHLETLKLELEAAAKGNSLGGLFQSVGISIGDTQNKRRRDPNALMSEYINVIEAELEGQLKNGQYNKNVKVSRPMEVYRIMFLRFLQQKETKIVYLPAEMVSYIAFNYDDYGIGKSLLDNTKIFGSLRAILLFAEVISGVKSAVGRTKLNITLDEDEIDHAKTIEEMIHEFAGMQSEALPLGRLTAGDIVRSLQKASIDVEVDGGEAFPRTKSEIIETNREYHQPNMDLDETLRRMQYAGFGVLPEIIDNVMNGDVATIFVARNQLFAKQIMDYAASSEKQFSARLQRYIRCSGELLRRIRKDVKAEQLEDFIQAVTANLPDPDLAGISSQHEALTEFSEAVDFAVGFYVNEEMVSYIFDRKIDPGAMNNLRVTIASLIKRDWMAKQGILPEVGATILDEEIKDRLTEFNETIMDTLGTVMQKLLELETKADKDNETAKGGEEEESSSGSDDGWGGGGWGSDTDETDTGEETDGDEEGSDDLAEEEEAADDTGSGEEGGDESGGILDDEGTEEV